MRSLIAGIDETGRSCILNEVQIPARRDVAGPSSRTDIFALRETPPPPRPPGRTRYHDTGLTAGHADFMVYQMAPDVELPMHHADILSFRTVVTGWVDILLDDGPHRLEAGDSVVLPGIDHGWRLGPEGCSMTMLNLGSVRPT